MLIEMFIEILKLAKRQTHVTDCGRIAGAASTGTGAMTVMFVPRCDASLGTVSAGSGGVYGCPRIRDTRFERQQQKLNRTENQNEITSRHPNFGNTRVVGFHPLYMFNVLVWLVRGFLSRTLIGQSLFEGRCTPE